MPDFLIDASLPRSVAPMIQASGHSATDVRDIGLGTADDREIAEYARQRQMCLLTRDMDFAHVLDYPPQDYFGIVVIEAPRRASSEVVLKLVAAFIEQSSLLASVVGRLIVVEPGRVRLRPP